MKNKLLYSCLFFCVSISSIFAQKSTKEIKGDKYYSYYLFNKAIKKYSTADTLTMDGKRKLAESYKNVGRYKKSEETYNEICIEREATAEDFYNYSSILRMNGNYSEAETWIKKFAKLRPKDLRAKSYMAGKAGFDDISKDDNQFDIKNLDVNTKEEDFGAVFFNEKIMYASIKKKAKPVKRSYNWNSKSFFDLYSAEISADGQLNNAQPFRFNKKMHEGPAAFAKEGTLMAFTQNSYDGKKKDGAVKLQIFFSEFKDGVWQKEQTFKYNSSDYSVAHPWLSADGNTMYFSSDMQGGYGATDIYKVTRTEGGEWGDVINLGNKINTEGDEMFPFVEEKTNYLYFASSGHLGLGGLDLFLAVLKPDRVGKIVNMGFPLNGQYDDFGLIINTDAKKGYFSSNRLVGKGDDDIYAFELLKPFVFEKVISGKVSDTNKNFIPGSVVRLYDKEGNVVDSIMSDENAFFSFVVEADEKQYDLVSYSGPKYTAGKNTANTAVYEDIIIADIVVEKLPEFTLYGVLADKITKTPVVGAKITLTDKLSGKKEELVSSETGDFSKQLKDSKLNDVISYNIRIEKDGYFARVAEYNKTLTREGRYNMKEELDADLVKFEVGMDLGKLLGIYPIYFDYNKFDIRADAALELEKIVKVMNENPAMVVELGSHTDCRGFGAYNRELAENRAKASAEYVKQRISNPERIYGKGYGEDKLKNDCTCEGALRSACPEEQHQQNRRTEFIILKVN